MKKIAFCILALVSLNSMASDAPSGSGLMLSAAGIYYSDTSIVSVKRTRTNMFYDIQFGYRKENIFIGINYSVMQEQWEDKSATATDKYTWSRTAWGPTFGLFFSSMFATATYFLSAEHKDKRPSSEIKYTAATGLSASLGYRIQLSNSIDFVPTLAYHSFQYSQSEEGGVVTSLSQKVTKSYLRPFVGFIYRYD